MSEIEKKRAAWHLQAGESNARMQVARKVDDSTWQLLAKNINENLELTKSESLLDVGCGNAYLLALLNINPNTTFGTDFAEKMIYEARRRLPDSHFAQAEANKVPFSGPFSRILSYSIFHYFPNENYVTEVLSQLIELSTPGGIILLGDLLDKTHEQEIKANSDPEIEKTLPIIHRYSQWLFLDLGELSQWLLMHEKVKDVEILAQPQEFTLSWYRKDLKITLK